MTRKVTADSLFFCALDAILVLISAKTLPICAVDTLLVTLLSLVCAMKSDKT